MDNHVFVTVALIITIISFFGFIIWNAVKKAHYNNSPEWKMVVTKARAASSKVLLAAVAGWGIATIFELNELFFFRNVEIYTQILFGAQCLVALISGIYYERKMQG